MYCIDNRSHGPLSSKLLRDPNTKAAPNMNMLNNSSPQEVNHETAASGCKGAGQWVGTPSIWARVRQPSTLKLGVWPRVDILAQGWGLQNSYNDWFLHVTRAQGLQNQSDIKQHLFVAFSSGIQTRDLIPVWEP